MIGVMAYTFARVSAMIGMRVEDYFQQGKRWWFRLHEKGGKYHEVPAHHKAEEYVDAWLHPPGSGTKRNCPSALTAKTAICATAACIGKTCCA